ncbi:MAG TPA: deoxynucleoside kinase [Bacteroidota bacterium]|nr:deoxynucleoside kinase [Bacteroidota bacterium]
MPRTIATPRRPKRKIAVPHSKVFLGIAGNIGSGKSSLTRLLAEHFGWTPYFESVEDNPYLRDFYGDMSRWSFHLQVYFLSNRFRSHKAIVEGGDAVVLDRVIYEDAEIFARNLYEIGKMDERDYRNYIALYEVMTEYLRPPDLLIYLRASIDTLLRQIALRGRSYEQAIPREYLEQLNRHYESWIKRYDKGPLLVVESDDLDFVNNQDDYETLMSTIAGALTKGKAKGKKRKSS